MFLWEGLRAEQARFSKRKKKQEWITEVDLAGGALFIGGTRIIRRLEPQQRAVLKHTDNLTLLFLYLVAMHLVNASLR